MTWAIVAGIITLAGFLISVGTLAFKLSSVLTRLDVTVKELGESFRSDRKAKEKEHADMYDTLDDHEKRLQGHEMRIHDLEKEREK